MAEFALFVDGAFREIRRYKARPDDIAHKNVNWYPVVRESVDNSTQEYVDKSTTRQLEGDNYVIRVTIFDRSQAEIDAAIETRKDQALLTVNQDYQSLKAVAQVLFELTNQVRALNAQPDITKQQFVDYLRSKL